LLLLLFFLLYLDLRGLADEEERAVVQSLRTQDHRPVTPLYCAHNLIYSHTRTGEKTGEQEMSSLTAQDPPSALHAHRVLRWPFEMPAFFCRDKKHHGITTF